MVNLGYQIMRHSKKDNLSFKSKFIFVLTKFMIYIFEFAIFFMVQFLIPTQTQLMAVCIPETDVTENVLD